VPLAARLEKLSPGCRAIDNVHALIGGFRMWKTVGESNQFNNPL
jgi:hypothetical protein